MPLEKRQLSTFSIFYRPCDYSFDRRCFNLLTKIINFVGEDVAYGMMAAVGIILVKAAIAYDQE